MELPENWQFLGRFWWMLHLVAVGVVFWVGFLIGRVSAEKNEKSGGKEKW